MLHISFVFPPPLPPPPPLLPPHYFFSLNDRHYIAIVFPPSPPLYCHCFPPPLLLSSLPHFHCFNTTTPVTFLLFFCQTGYLDGPCVLFFSRFYCFFLLLRHHHHHHHIFIVVLPDGLKPDQEGQTRAKISKIR